VNFVGTIFNDYKSFRNFLMEENPEEVVFYELNFIIIKTVFFFNASKGQCFVQFYIRVDREALVSERALEALFSRL
jgi:hypothetical protein